MVAKTNAAGSLTYLASYEAFGTRTAEVGATADRQKANTKDEDPTGLLNEGFRYRDLDTGAFISRDPLMFVDGPNMYAYVVQNPWTFFDPLGLQKARSKSWQRAKAVRMAKQAARRAQWWGSPTGQRVSGGMQMVGGGVEAVVGGAGVMAPEPVTSIAGAVAVVHGYDNMQTGWSKLLTGQPVNTATHQAISRTSEALGASSETANTIATYSEMAIEVGAPTKVVASQIANTGKLAPVVSARVSQAESAAAAKTIDPFTVRFSQSSVSSDFASGGSVADLADGLRSGTVKAADVPAIRLLEKDGQMFTLDNRRLEAFRRAETPVPYRMATPEEAADEAWKFTTKNNGESVRVRGE